VTRRFGLNPVDLAQQVGIDAAALANPDDRVPVAAACELMELTAEKASCPTFGLQVAETRQKFGVGVVNVLLAHKRTLSEVLLATAQYRHLLNEALAMYVETAGDTVTIREELVVDPGTPTRQAIELAAGVLYAPLQRPARCPLETASHPLRPSRPGRSDFSSALFRLPRGVRQRLQRVRLWCCRPRVSESRRRSGTGEICKSLADPIKVAGTDSKALEVRKAIFLLLPLEQAMVEQVARHLGLSVRTMQRQLDVAGTSFTALLDEVRRELAMRYMSNPCYPISRVAVLPGYNQQALSRNGSSRDSARRHARGVPLN
jgi:AraC-like DNA-binding protein